MNFGRANIKFSSFSFFLLWLRCPACNCCHCAAVMKFPCLTCFQSFTLLIKTSLLGANIMWNSPHQSFLTIMCLHPVSELLTHEKRPLFIYWLRYGSSSSSPAEMVHLEAGVWCCDTMLLLRSFAGQEPNHADDQLPTVAEPQQTPLSYWWWPLKTLVSADGRAPIKACVWRCVDISPSSTEYKHNAAWLLMLVPCVSTFIYIKVTQEVNVPFFPVKQCIDLLSFELIAWLLLLWAQSRQATGVTYRFNGSQVPNVRAHLLLCKPQRHRCYD